MNEKEIISALKYTSRMKQEFMLSELCRCIKSEVSVQELHRVIAPLLMDMGLDMFPSEGDFRLVRAPKGPIQINGAEKEKNDMFFQAPGLSRKLERLIEQYIEKKTGKSWDDQIILERIRKAILSQKADYWKEGSSRKIAYDKGYDVLAYLAYQFPVYFIQFQHILYDMAKDSLLKKRMKILDIGSGPGTIPLAIIDFYNRLDEAMANIYSVELFDENIEAYKALVSPYAAIKGRVSVEEPIRADIGKLDISLLPDGLDLIVFSNVLNEIRGMDIKQKADLVKQISNKLSMNGNIVIIEPADKVNSTEMRKLVLMLMDAGLGIYSPCSFIWSTGCRPIECWSFEQQGDIEAPRLMKKLADTEEAYRYLNTDIKYTSVIMRRDKLTRSKYRVPTKAKFARLAKMSEHVGKRINVICSIMSADLGDEEYHLFKICDGTSIRSVYAVLPSKSCTEDNIFLLKAKYGTLITIENILVKYNDANDSYNLLVGRATVIGPVVNELT